jgi:hypothetical protein
MNNTSGDKQQMIGNDEGEEFIVDRIVSHRFRNGRKEYLLAWKGYSEEENTWVINNIFFLNQKMFIQLGTAAKLRLSRFN